MKFTIRIWPASNMKEYYVKIEPTYSYSRSASYLEVKYRALVETPQGEEKIVEGTMTLPAGAENVEEEIRKSLEKSGLKVKTVLSYESKLHKKYKATTIPFAEPRLLKKIENVRGVKLPETVQIEPLRVIRLKLLKEAVPILLARLLKGAKFSAALSRERPNEVVIVAELSPSAVMQLREFVHGSGRSFGRALSYKLLKIGAPPYSEREYYELTSKLVPCLTRIGFSSESIRMPIVRRLESEMTGFENLNNLQEAY